MQEQDAKYSIELLTHQTTVCPFSCVKNYLFITQAKIIFYRNQMLAKFL